MDTKQTNMSAQRTLGAHVNGRAYTVWLDDEGKPVRVTACGSRFQSLALHSKVARAAIAKAGGA